LGLSPKAAQSIIDKLKQSYPQAFAFMDAIQEEAKSGFITDKLGRKYPFSDREPYKARNAIIQGVGALVCLEKLVELYEARMSDLKLVASIHDAYVGIADEKLIDKIGVCCREVLETESKLAPGLFLKAVAKVGPKWHEVQNLI
jgi:DNA polymerase I-like protein with 3'-5' exonuclease and polymerase domains